MYRRRRRGPSLIEELIRMFVDDEYEPNKRRFRTDRPYPPTGRNREEIAAGMRNALLQEALMKQIEEDKARKEHYEEILRQQQAEQIGRPKYHGDDDDDDPTMESL